MDEVYYWRAFKAGDDKAFAKLYEMLWKEMFVYAVRMMQDKGEAEDIVQEIFTKLWEKRSELQDVEKIKPYLYQWSRHNILNRFKEQDIHDKHMEAFKLTLEISKDITSQVIIEKDLNNHLLKSIEGLPERMREVFYLNAMEHLTVKEIAERLNISEQTVRNQINMAIKRLKNIIAYTLLFIFR